LKYQKVACFFNKLDDFIVNGYYKFLQKNYNEVIEFYGFVIDAKRNGDKDIESSVYLSKWYFTYDELLFEYATFYAVQGKGEEALDLIRKTIKNGYNDIETCYNEKNLVSLHSRTEWRDLRTAILKNKGEKDVEGT